MGEESFYVDTSYQGSVFLGWATGTFETERKEKRPYYNMFVLSPVSSYVSEDYQAFGFKAEKKKCIGKALRLCLSALSYGWGTGSRLAIGHLQKSLHSKVFWS